MNILILELKKIFKPLNLILIVLMTLIAYNRFIMPEIHILKNSQPLKQINNIGVMLANNYGSTIDSKEFEEVKKLRDDKEKIATEYLINQPESKKANIKHYKDFYNARDQDFEQRREHVDINLMKKIEERVLFEENIYLFWELPQIENYIVNYEHKNNVINRDIDYYKSIVSNRGIDRLRAIGESEKFTSPMNGTVHNNYDKLMFWETVIVIISLAIIISPIFITDNRNKINYMQYSSKIGRNIVKKKVIAGIITSFIIVTFHLIIFFIVYKQLGTFAYLDTYINSFLASGYFWFDLTFRQYIVMTVIILYIISLLTCFISMYISSRVNSYLSLIGIQIPILYGIIMMQLKFGTTSVTSILLPKYTTLGIYASIIIINMAMFLYIIKKENSIDIK
ncbi:hypothetical protein [Paraclostridium sordellii]|uniref:hypothetical protein n=1 Tax=Paraclostridium sordellii TaxID=1505 RepID=UPI0005412936|nr:hypothetical protein [Paeniclostridium sordellii]MCH1964660.1 hypothetical protein [Paeniclostridium sordellii]MCQ4699155.1 hypothetical protein [Paeniclostridium sordellii]MDU6482814.1 hypothetical protein [Paeniclostridium sordellii]CEK39988.1 ABC-type transport system, multidrug-family permease [[Clostridium] sordellii] [Paeniclostridium sordellii]